MKKLILVFMLMGLMANISPIQAKRIGPVNRHASKEVHNLLDFLYSVKGKYTLAGQHNFAMSGSKYDEMVLDITGKYPVVWGCDFSFNVFGQNASKFQHCGPMNLSDPLEPFAFNGLEPDKVRSQMIEEAKKQYSQGHIIT
ncbi:MAG TPA: glycosyl hydrolase, partial [Prolixibacteraceae bacterium]|nr:glycosyl hydrolase [Prolixibacteraceae bacterium]